MAKPSEYPIEEKDKESEEDMTQLEEIKSKIDTLMSAFNIEKMSELIDEKISKNNEELLTTLGKGTPVPKEIVKDGKTYVLKGEHDDEDMDKEDKEEMDKEDEDEEVKKAFTAKISELEKLLKSRFADTPTSNPVAQDDNIAKGGVMKSDILKSIESAPHLDKIEHRESYYNVKWSNDDQEFQARIKKAHEQTGFDPSVLGMSLPSNEL
jgi:DNA-directed RNA polymerase specialized sigma subunit